MAKYGARYVKWAPFASENPEPENAEPNYGETIEMSKLVKVTDNPRFAEGKLHGDDELAEYASEFTEADVDMELTDISNQMASSMLGAKLEEGGDIAHGADDNAPYGGLGFVSCRMVNNVKYYVGVFYAKVKAIMQGEEYETKGDNINFVTGKMKFKAKATKSGKWKRVSKNYTTLDEAKAWLDGKFKKT